MHSLYVAALVPTAVVLGIPGAILWGTSPRAERPLIAALFALELPMFFVSSFVLRDPLNAFIDARVDPASAGGLWLRSFQAPLVEEPCKLWLLFLAWHLGRVTPLNALRVGMTIGVSFGVSEIWGLAVRFAQDPSTLGHPFWHFAGFISERAMVAPLHGVFVAAAAMRLGQGPRGVALGVLTAMGLHYLANFPIVLARLGAFGLSKTIWQVILVNYTTLFSVLLLVVFLSFVKTSATRRRAAEKAASAA